MQARPNYILPLIVLSQFAGTSLWFVGNAILPELQTQLNIRSGISTITSIVQFGFISGTFLFALLSITDRFAPSKVFFVSSLLAALFNIGIIWFATDSFSLLVCRFITGFFLAGIYPVGMKIAADWYEKGLGKALGWLVGALVLGTAFPHLLKSSSIHLPAREILIYTSLFALVGGILILTLVKEGPYRKRGQSFHPSQVFSIFRSKDFRSAAFGYFGHMWELYAFWAYVPMMIALHNTGHLMLNIPLWSFIIIGIGAVSCVAGGYLSQSWGSARTAFLALLFSGLCCLLSFLLPSMSTPVFLFFMITWGVMVIADSPQFSALVSQTAPANYKGTALTLVTCIGFSITIGSIELLNYLFDRPASTESIFMVLGIGPLFGLIFLYHSIKKKSRISE